MIRSYKKARSSLQIKGVEGIRPRLSTKAGGLGCGAFFAPPLGLGLEIHI